MKRLARKRSSSSVASSSSKENQAAAKQSRLSAFFGKRQQRFTSISNTAHETPPEPPKPLLNLEKGSASNDDPFDDSFIFDDSNVSHSSVIEEPLSSRYGRHRVEAVDRDKVYEVVLHLRPEVERRRGFKKCVLRGSWINTRVSVGDTVNVLAPDDATARGDEIAVDDKSETLVVVHPDVLVSGTSIMASMFCQRKAVLSEYFKSFKKDSRVMFVGTVVHQLLQACLQNRAQTWTDVQREMEACLQTPDVRKALLDLNLKEDELRREIEPFLPHVVFFIDKYVGAKDVAVPVPAFAAGNKHADPQIWPGRIVEVQDIEENIWSARLGIKGKVDLTVRVQNDDVVPLELKTGRPSGSAEHRGQVILYSMMMAERRHPDPGSGLLLYLRNSSLIDVRAGKAEQRGLIQLRNDLVSNLLSSSDFKALPEPINAKRACQQCEMLPVCAIQQRLNQDTAPAAPEHFKDELMPQTLSHLKDTDLDFYRHHSTNCLLETGQVRQGSKLKSLWQDLPSTREARKTAVCDLTLDDVSAHHRRHSFTKQNVPTSVLRAGETVIVSTDATLALAQGPVVRVDTNRVVVDLDRTLVADDHQKYHLDRYEYNLTSPFSSGSSNLVNLAKLMLDNPRAAKLRSLIIDRAPVTFSPTLNREFAVVAKHILRPLNVVQQKAVFKTLMAQDYALLEGMPGTGKTTVIVALIRLLMVLGKSVLLTAYTHSAVDNVLRKIAATAKSGEKALDFVRVGNAGRVHPGVRERTFEHRLRTEEADALLKVPLVATTCLGVNHPAVTRRRFDFCIVDEAGQSLMLAAVGPLFHCDRFVLVGDPNQLPPVVTSPLARERGMDVSLFSHLAVRRDGEGQNVIPLTMQYRMNRGIQDLANHLTYGDQLQCGNDDVAHRKIESDISVAEDKTWKARFCDESLSVMFFNSSKKTHSMSEFSDDGHNGLVNLGEAKLVKALCLAAASHFVLPASTNRLSLGVMSPYRAQVSHLSDVLKDFEAPNMDVDVNTVDQFQGADRDIVLYSCTRTTPSKTGLDILSDRRRLNVAITRAKSKLVLIGNADSLKTFEPFMKILTYLESKNLVFDLDDLQLDD